MKRFAVGYYSLFDNKLTIKIVKADDWFNALILHPNIYGLELSDSSLEDAKRDAFDCDAGIDVIEIE